MKFLLCIFLLLALKGFCDEEQSIEERIKFLEQKRGYKFKKRSFLGIADGYLLYWKADVDGTAYATELNGSDIKARTPHFSYDPGFRVALGFQSPYDLYDVILTWTRFITEGRDRARGEVLGIGLIQELISTPSSASAKCKIQENFLDVQLGRGIAVSRQFFMRPYFGVRGVWSAIDWNIKLERNLSIPETFNQDATSLKMSNDFEGIGGLAGVNLDWKAPMGLGVHLRGSAALVWGPTDERTKQKYLLVPAGSSTEFKENFKARNSFHSLKSMWELFVGVFWEIRFSQPEEHSDKRTQHISLRLVAGYEIQHWPYFGQKTNVQVSRERDRFSMGFQGFTGGARLVF